MPYNSGLKHLFNLLVNLSLLEWGIAVGSNHYWSSIRNQRNSVNVPRHRRYGCWFAEKALVSLGSSSPLVCNFELSGTIEDVQKCIPCCLLCTAFTIRFESITLREGFNTPCNVISLPSKVNVIRSCEQSHIIGPNILNDCIPRTISNSLNNNK